jgi:cystathionine gamma-synthase
VIDFIEEEQPREEYGRYGNPGERVAERKLAALEGGEAAVLYSSGMAAMVGLLMAKLNAGDEVIFDECCHRYEFCAKHLRGSASTVQVKACDYDAMEAAITPSKLLITSRPPIHTSIVDLDRFAEIGNHHDIET